MEWESYYEEQVMIIYRCDGCGCEIPAGSLRYTVKIDVRAAYEKQEISLTELVRDHRKEILQLIDQLESRDTRELEESIYKSIKLDLCPSCHPAYIQNPVGFKARSDVQSIPVDIDSFLRSLGYGPGNSSSDDS